jgi:hypothetical protein
MKLIRTEEVNMSIMATKEKLGALDWPQILNIEEHDVSDHENSRGELSRAREPRPLLNEWPFTNRPRPSGFERTRSSYLIKKIA